MSVSTRNSRPQNATPFGQNPQTFRPRPNHFQNHGQRPDFIFEELFHGDATMPPRQNQYVATSDEVQEELPDEENPIFDEDTVIIDHDDPNFQLTPNNPNFQFTQDNQNFHLTQNNPDST